MPHLLSNQARSHPGVECVEVIKAVQDGEVRGVGLKTAGGALCLVKTPVKTIRVPGIRPVCSFLMFVALFLGATDMSHFRVHWRHAFCSSVRTLG